MNSIRCQLQVLRLNSRRSSPNFRNWGIRGYRSSSNQYTGPIVISGLSGRFPKANSTKELNAKLLKGEELTSETRSRWMDGKLPKRFGFLQCLDKFDAGFFNCTPQQANLLDPQIRLLLESTFEAIVDAGLNPTDLRGSETGVFCAAVGGETMDYRIFHYNKEDEGNHILGAANFMIAARIAFNLDLRGPSSLACTACSSSFTALEIAVQYIEAGKCEAAIVTGSSVRLNPLDSTDYMALKAVAPDGRCKTFDESANGFVRSEAAMAILIQKEADAKRSYARIKGIRSNTAGFKHAGLTHPTRASQQILLEKTYEDAGLDPANVSYLEAHGTGTPAGDPEEIHAVHRVFCQGKEREKPLLIGSVKSNLGHTESAAGLVGVAKVIGAIQGGIIPGNLFFKKPNPETKSLFDGSLQVVTEPLGFDGGIVGITSMGIGGTNAHLILEPTPKKVKKNTIHLPILLPISGRSEAKVAESINEARDHIDNPEFTYLVQKAYEKHIPGLASRGFGLFHSGKGKEHVEVARCESRTRPVYVVFPGMGSQWSGMGRDLLKIEPFAESIQQSRTTLRNLGLDLDYLLKENNQSIFTDIHDAFIAITVMQMALWDTLKELQFRVDAFIGHSAGECLCAYADGCYTAEETLQLTHARGCAMIETQKVKGGMSSIGMSADEIKSRLPPGIELACYNTPNNVTVSGEHEILTLFTKKIRDEGGFAVPVNTCGTAAHSSYVREAGALLKSLAQDIIKGDRPRSPRWISTSIPEAQWGSELAKFASPEYIENNVVSPVLFYQALQHVVPGSIVIEVSPKGFFQALLAETVPMDCIHVAPMTAKSDDKLWHFFLSIGRMYNSGLDMEMDKLYPAVATPVSSDVPSLSPLVKWDHSATWKTSVLDLPLDITFESTIDIERSSHAYLAGHKVDNRFVMPATGLLCGVWNQLGDIHGRDYESFTVQFKNVVLKRATTLSPGVESTFIYKIDSKTGIFTIQNQDEIVANGQVEIVDKIKVNGTEHFPLPQDSTSNDDLVLTKEDVYKEIRLQGCNYTGLFQGVEAIDSKGRWSDVAWKGNWTCFLDAIFHLKFFFSTSKHLALPVDIELITIDPVELKKELQRTFDETGRHLVRVHNLPHQKTITAPGIEIRAVEFRRVPQVLRRSNLAYERYTFCPLLNTSRDTIASFEEMLDLVLENSPELHLEVADIFTNKDNSLTRDFNQVLSRKPRQDSTISMITLKHEAEKLSESADVVANVIAKETKESLTPQTPTDVVFLDDPTLLPFVVPTVKTSGFLLVQSMEGVVNQELSSLCLCSTRSFRGKILNLYRKVELDIPEIVHVTVDSADFAWVPELQAVIRNSKESKCKIFVTSQGNPGNGILGLVNCLRLEDGGEKIRCIFDPEAKLSFNFKEPDDILRSIISKDLVVNVYKDGVLGSYRHVSIEKEHQETLVTLKEAFVGTLTPTDLSSFRWIESPLPQESYEHPISSTPHPEISLKQYKVAYAPLNFRDVLLATGTIPLGDEFTYSGSYLGFEFSGYDEEGQRVMGFCPGNGLATSVMADPRFVWEVPNMWSLEEAATIPIVYATVLYAFHTRAQLQPGQSVLIHSGTGGVGQAAINIALAHGCQVFTTVGTAEKRDYIKETFPQITDDYIGNSRDTSFLTQIMQVTGGRGVDVALNSLAGDKLLATVGCVADNGTFLEIGVFDAFMNTQMGLRPLIKNINICGVELIHMTQSVQGYDKVLRQLLDEGIRSGAIKPLPRRVFECNQFEEAFRFMASGKHMGKLVVKIRDESNWKEPLKLPPVIKRSYFASNKTYLIVGGLGGLGLEVAGWMIQRGARKLVLNSRSGVTTGYQALCIRRWREAGVEISTPTVDLSDEFAAELFIKTMLEQGEILGGIFNSALSLGDEEFLKQTVGAFQQVSIPKDCIMKNLDKISREHCSDIDYFVAFSSISCGRGNAGQTNYGLANSAMERICEKRREDGLHGLAIQWGIVGEVGVVAEKLFKGMDDETFELQGTKAQSLHSCLEVLDAALQQPYPVVSSCLLAEKGTKKRERLGLLFRMEKMFGITDFKAIPREKKLSELGLDSLVAVELKQTLEREQEISVTKELLHLMTVGDILSIDAGTFDAKKLRTSGGSHEIYVPFKLHKTSLVALKSHPSSSRNVFIVYGTDGGCDNFKPLASLLNANVYGFQFTGKNGWNSIPELAVLYVDEIRAKELAGPYTIMGFSGGAAIAFEIAQRLQQLDQDVQSLVFLDGCPSFEKQNLNRTFALDMLKSMNVLRNLPADAVKSFESALTGDLGQDFLEILKVFKLATGYEPTVEEADAYAFLTKQLAQHIPREQYNGKVALIQATEPSITLFTPSEDYETSKFCSGQVVRHKVKGNHLSFLSDENVGETASVINGLLN